MKKTIKLLKTKAVLGAGTLAMAGGLYAFTMVTATPGYADKKGGTVKWNPVTEECRAIGAIVCLDTFVVIGKPVD
ncbi:MAG: hypothetical protein WBA12_02140 [Catalinimonas sp.]